MIRSAAGSPRRLWLGHVPVDALSFDEAIARICALVEQGRGGTVFTPNVDHVILGQEHQALQEAYAAADLALVDGVPVLWFSRLLGLAAPEKISGSDLVRPLLREAARRGFRVCLYGAGDGVAARAAEILRCENPGLEVVATLNPRIDMSRLPSQRAGLRRELRETQADLVLLALGAPKAETFAQECRAEMPAAVFVCVGAGLDFVVGTVRRAPRWVSTAGFEWLFRLAQEPRRLWRRYLVRGPRALPLFLGLLLSPRRARQAPHARAASRSV